MNQAVEQRAPKPAAGRGGGAGQGGLRVRLHAPDPARQRRLIAMLAAAGHAPVTDAPDVILCDLDNGQHLPAEAEAPVVALTGRPPAGAEPAGLLRRDATAGQLDLALRAVAGGLQVRGPGPWPAAVEAGFAAAAEDAAFPPLTPRETEILALVGQGLSNKAVARRLAISVHTVKFHLEALFAKLGAASRAEAVAKGLRGRVIEL